MKYYAFEVAEGDSKIAGAAVGTFDNQNEAIASFHGRLSTAMKSDLYESDLVMVIDESGMVLRAEKYIKPYVPPVVETPDTTTVTE